MAGTLELTGSETPWGLPEHLLKPSKVQTDPIHQDIYWNEIERRIIDSRAYQRLRHVKQLGMTLKVYPGAEHSRFTHGLGTLQAAQSIIDRVVANRAGPRPIPSLLDEWDDRGVLEIRLKEATVLARLTALIHDVAHVPFGHTIEDDLGVLKSHDKNVERFNAIWGELPSDVRMAIGTATTQSPEEGRETNLFVELKAIVLDKVEMPDGWQSLYPFVGDVVNNTICADLLDYLKRDHYFTGLPFAVGDRFMDNFYIAPASEASKHKEHLIVRVTRGGESRVDIVTELFKYLRYRYEVTERALYHKTKLAFDAMLGKLLEMWHDAIWHEKALAAFPELQNAEKQLDATWLEARVKQLAQDRPDGSVKTPDQLENETAAELERHFRFFGDEGLIEHLIWDLDERSRVLQANGEADIDERWQAIKVLAEQLRFREHFRMLAHAGGPEVIPSARDKYEQFGSAEERRKLERAAAKWAGLDPAWKVVLWVPSPEMRLKLADVLIEDRGMISTLAARYDDARVIAKRHEELWTVRVYAAPELRADERMVNRLLSYIHDRMKLPFYKADGTPVISSNRLAAEEVASEVGTRLTREQVEQVAADLEQVAARSESDKTFEDLLASARALAETRSGAG